MGKVLLYFLLVLGFLVVARLPILGVLYILVVVGGLWIHKHFKPSTPSPPQPAFSGFPQEVSYAVGVLSDRKRRESTLEFVKLAETFGTGFEEKIVAPALVELQPTPYGARAVFSGLVGQELADWKRATGRLSSALCVSAVVAKETNPGFFDLELRGRDPLAEPWFVDQLAAVTQWSLPLGRDESGQMRWLPLSNVSGVVLGGLPGSGKTAWLTSCLASFSACNAVQYLIVDGKGGMDLAGLAPRAYRFLNDDLDLDAVIESLREVQILVRERMRNLLQLTGTSNFWNRGPSLELPLIFVVIDECQTFLDPRQLVTKEQKAKGAEIHGLVSHLVRKGRSAGVVTIVATQKPTADSLPTDIRDNSTLRICFGVQSIHAASAVLGDDWGSDSEASPLSMPVGVGVAAAGNGYFRFRSPYVPEHVVATFVAEAAHHREHPSLLFKSAMASQR